MIEKFIVIPRKSELESYIEIEVDGEPVLLYKYDAERCANIIEMLLQKAYNEGKSDAIETMMGNITRGVWDVEP